MTNKLILHLEQSEYTALLDEANRELRMLSDQARWLLRKALGFAGNRPLGAIAHEMQSEYSHRNGETTPPTIEGRFYFRGQITDINIKSPNDCYNGLTDIYHKNGKRVRLIEYGVHRTFLQRCEGQWWGPIVPPWDEQP